ncbi:MAG: PaaI family thioesterase [Anaerolineales bacterium]|nr:PaaI family thioesterase [Anaerolineales bacterium]
MTLSHDVRKAIDSLPLIRDLGITFQYFGEGACQCSLPITPRLLTPHGSLHGGMTFTLADTGMGFAVFSVLEPKERATTISISIRYLKPAMGEGISANCRVVQRGSNIATTQAEIRDGDDNLVALADGSFYIWQH